MYVPAFLTGFLIFFYRLLIAQITIFNYRRSGEFTRMTIEQFKNKHKGGEVLQEGLQLTDAERIIRQYMEVVILKGKNNGKVLSFKHQWCGD